MNHHKKDKYFKSRNLFKEMALIEKQNKELKYKLNYYFLENVKLKKENKKLKNENKDLIKKLDTEKRKIRSLDNENTPTSKMPAYMKPNIEKINKYVPIKTKRKNIRNKRTNIYDEMQVHETKVCKFCGSKNIIQNTVKKRITITIVYPKKKVILHKNKGYYCKNCKKSFVVNDKNSLPKAKFSLDVMILISFLYIALNMSYSNIIVLMKKTYNITVSKATISNMLAKFNLFLGPIYEKYKKKVLMEKVRYRDETSWRKNGLTFWMWVIATKKEILYHIDKKRDGKVVELFKSKKGVDVHDAWKPYNILENEHQLCWAHALRRFKKPKYYFKSKEENIDFYILKDEINILFSKAKIDKEEKEISKKLRLKYDEKLLEILEKKRVLGQNANWVVNYFMDNISKWFIFLEYEEVEPTNNFAERALRHPVIKRKISFQNRSTKSMNSFAKLSSVYQTTKQLKQNYFEILKNEVQKNM